MARFFGMTPDFWLNLQLRSDLYHAQQNEQPVLERIAPLSPGPLPEQPA